MAERWPGETDIIEAWEWKRSEAPTREFPAAAPTLVLKPQPVLPQPVLPTSDTASFDYYPCVEGMSEKSDNILGQIILVCIFPPALLIYLFVWIGKLFSDS